MIWPRRKSRTADPTGTVHIYRDTAGEWRWRLTARNHEIVAHGEGYTRAADAFRGSVAARRAFERPEWTEES